MTRISESDAEAIWQQMTKGDRIKLADIMIDEGIIGSNRRTAIGFASWKGLQTFRPAVKRLMDEMGLKDVFLG